MFRRLPDGSYLLCVLPTDLSEEVICLYVGGYVFLMFALACVLSNLVATAGSNFGISSILAFSVQLRVRWVLIYFLLSLAGLPPFFFFVCKLGLLSLVLCEGSFLACIAVVVLVFLS